MEIIFTKRFRKHYNLASQQVRKSFEERLEMFLKDKYIPILNNHSLKGGLMGYRSINITGDYRAIFKESKQGDIVIFVLLGKHSELYK